MSEPTGAAPAPRNIAKTITAALWMYGGRGFGMLWTLALISRLGIGDYGLYGMGFALAMVIGPPLDNPFAVRAVRESEQHFRSEQMSRFLLGSALMVCGLVAVRVNVVAFFGLFFAGAEMVFKAYQSQHVRDGNPDIAWRLDTIRTVSSIVAGGAYLYGHPHPTVLGAAMFYCTPYAVVWVLCGLQVRGRRPGIPGPPRIIAALVGEMLGTCLYLQGDVLLLGWLTNSTVVGYYSLTVTLTVAIAALGQSFGMTYHEPLRASDGDPAAGPPLRNTLILGGGAGLLVGLVGVGLLISPAPTQLGIAMLIMALFCAMRSISSVLQVILYVQRRDLIRLGANLGLVPVKLGLVAALAFAGAVGAAVASVISDAIILAIYSTAIYRRKAKQ